MANGKQITNITLYDFIDKVRLELKTDNIASYNNVMSEVRGLRNDFTDLEKGRLTRLEAQMNRFELDQAKKDAALDRNQAVLSTKFLVIGGISVAIFNALLYGLFTKVFK